MNSFYRVKSSWFVAGLLVDEQERIIQTAPVLKQFGGWLFPEFKRAAQGSNWSIQALGQLQSDTQLVLGELFSK